MPGNLNALATNRARAEAAWGPTMPAWVGLLADACDRTNQRVVADRLGKSNPYVSRIVRCSYAGDYAEAERQVRAVFGEERVSCPLFGDMALRTCIRNRRRPLSAGATNWTHVRFAQACPSCPNNTDNQED